MNIRGCNIEPPANFGAVYALIKVKLADSGHLRWGKFANSNLLSLTLSAFDEFIQIIVHSGSEKQMVWISAFAVIAVVTDHEIIWEVSVLQEVGDSVRKHLPTKIDFRSETELSVAPMIENTLPVPTKIRTALLYVSPELFLAFRRACHSFEKLLP